MPMELLRSVCVVLQIHGNAFSLSEPKERSRKLAVVCRHGDDLLRRNLDRRGSDADGVICRALTLGIFERSFCDANLGNGVGRQPISRQYACRLEKIPSRNAHE